MKTLTLQIGDRQWKRIVRLAGMYGLSPETEALLLMYQGIEEVEWVKKLPPIEEDFPSPLPASSANSPSVTDPGAPAKASGAGEQPSTHGSGGCTDEPSPTDGRGCPGRDTSRDMVCEGCGKPSDAAKVRCGHPVMENTLNDLPNRNTTWWECPHCGLRNGDELEEQWVLKLEPDVGQETAIKYVTGNCSPYPLPPSAPASPDMPRAGRAQSPPESGPARNLEKAE